MSEIEELNQSKSRGTRVVVAAVFALFAVTVYFIITENYAYVNSQEEQILTKLAAVANSVTLQIDAEEHRSLTERYPDKNDITSNTQDSIYLKYHRLLKKVAEKNMIESSIYTLQYDSLDKNYEFIITSAQKPYFRHSYKIFPEELFKKSTFGGVLSRHESENGVWLSAFAPIKNDDGEVVGLLQVDESFGSFLEKARRKLVKNLIIAAVVLAFISGLMIFYMRKNLNVDLNFKQKLIEKNEEINSQNEEIQSQNEKIQSTNKKLEDANKIIQFQNDRLWKINEDLDTTVQQRTSELEKAVKSLDALLYRSSHDIQGPIASMSGLLQLARLDVNNQDFDNYAEKLEGALEKLKVVTRNISSIYQIRRQTPDFKEVKWTDFFQNLNQNLTEKLRGKVKCDANVPEDVTLWTDPAFLRESLLHIMELIVAEDKPTELVFTISRPEGRVVIETLVFNALHIDELPLLESKEELDFKLDLFQGARINLYIANLSMRAIGGNVILKKPKKNSTNFKILLEIPQQNTEADNEEVNS